MQTETRKELLRHITSALVSVAAKSGSDLTEDKIAGILEQSLKALQPEDGEKFVTLIDHALTDTTLYRRPDVTEVRPQQLECDVVRFQNNKEKWVALVGLLDGYPYEIFTGLQDDEEGIVLPKTVTKGKIIKQVNPDGTKRYDFQFENKRGYKTTVPSSSPACCVTVCRSSMSSDWWAPSL